jgi:hypothetical protein
LFFSSVGKDEGIDVDNDIEENPEPKRKRSLVGN